MADTLPSTEAVPGPSPTKIAHSDTTELRTQTPPVSLEPPAAPEPEPERDLELVGLPTDFDPDAEPSAPEAKEVVDTEDILEVPIRSIEDEDAEEAAALAELEKRRNRMNGQGDDADGDEEEGDLTEILRGLAGNQGDGDEQGEGEGENEQGEDEIVAEQSEEAEIILGEEATPLEDSRPIHEVQAREPPAELEQENEDVQMQSINSSPLSDLPDLPSEMPLSPPPIPMSPPRPKTKRALPPPRAESPAESSTAGAKRARLTSHGRDNDPSVPIPRLNGSSAENGSKGRTEGEVLVTGKRVRKQRQELEYDDLESHSDSDLVPSTSNGKGKTKGVNGKPKAAPRRKKVDGAFSQSSGSQPKGPPRPKALNDTQMRKELKGKDRERQLAPCLRPRYNGWGKCTQCVAKTGGDSCRFKHFRIFKIDPDTAEILDTADFEYTRLTEDMTSLPREFNVPWTEDEIFRTERTIASMLLPVISRELRHAINKKAVVREVDVAKHRSVCDFCSSTIFGGFFFCKKCGKDYCLQCERYFSDSMEAVRESPWDIPDAARPRLQRCTLAPPAKGTLAGKAPEVPSGKKSDLGGPASTPVPALGPGPSTSDGTTPDNLLATRELGPGNQSDPSIDGAGREGLDGAPAPEERVSTPNIASQDNSLPTEPESQTNVEANTQRTDSMTATNPSTPEPTSLPIRHRSVHSTSKSVPAVATPQRRGQNFHVRPDLVPITRFHHKDLEEHWYKLVAFVLDGTGSLEERMKWLDPTFEPGTNNELAVGVNKYITKHPTSFPSGPNPELSEEEIKRYYSSITKPDVEPIPDPAELRDKSHPFMFIQSSELDNELFDRLWARGEPIVVDKIGERFKKVWTPDTFIERFGVEPCFVIDCETEAIKETSVGQFFEMFKDPAQRAAKGVWKLKDWPSTSDFQSAYPDLYNDFCDSLPVPDFTRREGVLNLYAHFPSGPTKPDIGPKMYNAFEGKETAGGQGSTRLHMDVADAINIMLYASPRSDGQPGCAVWDLFRAQDADTIRTFLKDKFGGKVIFTDPIHSQVFYLDSALRKELEEEYGVVSFRVYQYPGQAVFIPAGCAHQVCNLADCIKIALDFVSPHNVSRCQQLMHDFRKENYIKAWKDDVLQLYNVMWFAWLNARETRQRRLDEANAPPPASDQINGDSTAPSQNPPGSDRFRSLVTQVSAVRDEPTPTPQSQSPLQSRNPSPSPEPQSNDRPTPTSKASEEDTKRQDRLDLSKRLFEEMLLQSDAPPPVPIDEKGKVKVEEEQEVKKERQDRDPSIKTSQLVKLGVLPMEVALWGVSAQLKNDQQGDGGMEEMEMGRDEFRLGLEDV